MKVRWGRVGAATAVAVWGIAYFGSVTTLETATSTGPERVDSAMVWWEESRDALGDARELVEEGRPDVGLDRALTVWTSASQQMRVEPLLGTMVGIAIGMTAAEIVDTALANPRLSRASRNDARERLEVLADVRVDPVQLAERERAEMWTFVAQRPVLALQLWFAMEDVDETIERCLRDEQELHDDTLRLAGRAGSRVGSLTYAGQDDPRLRRRRPRRR